MSRRELAGDHRECTDLHSAAVQGRRKLVEDRAVPHAHSRMTVNDPVHAGLAEL
jgi:hypothetical protein